MRKSDEPNFQEMDKERPLPPLEKAHEPNTAPVGQGLLGAANSSGLFSNMSAFEPSMDPFLLAMGQQRAAPTSLSVMNGSMGMNGFSSMGAMNSFNSMFGSMNPSSMGSMNGLGSMNAAGAGVGNGGSSMGSMNGLGGLQGMHSMNHGMNPLRDSSGFMSSAMLMSTSNGDYDLQRLRQLQQMELLDRPLPDHEGNTSNGSLGVDMNPLPMNLMLSRQQC